MYAFSFVLANFGIAIAARIPMITTTINSSINVNPRRPVTCLPSGRLRAPNPKRTHVGPRATYSGNRTTILQEPCLTLRIDPIPSHTDTYNERHPQFRGPFHMAFYQVCGAPLLPFRHLEHELVVHLQQHPRGKTALSHRPLDRDHGYLDQVGGGSLERRVGRSALAERADIEVPVLQLRDVAASPEQRLHVPPLARLGDGPIEPGPHAGEPRKILRDELFRLLLGDAELAGEGERSLSVDRGEIDRLRPAAHLRRHLLLGHVKDARRRLAMDVPTLLEGPHERRVAGQVGEQPQLDLRVVGREEQPPRGGPEGSPDRLAARRPHGDVLEVRVGG